MNEKKEPVGKMTVDSILSKILIIAQKSGDKEKQSPATQLEFDLHADVLKAIAAEGNELAKAAIKTLEIDYFRAIY